MYLRCQHLCDFYEITEKLDQQSCQRCCLQNSEECAVDPGKSKVYFFLGISLNPVNPDGEKCRKTISQWWMEFLIACHN